MLKKSKHCSNTPQTVLFNWGFSFVIKIVAILTAILDDVIPTPPPLPASETHRETTKTKYNFYFMKGINFVFNKILRTPVRKYREFRDSTKKSNFFLFFQKVPFDELFSKKICKRSSAFYYLRNEENSKMRPDRPRSAQIAVGNYAK